MKDSVADSLPFGSQTALSLAFAAHSAEQMVCLLVSEQVTTSSLPRSDTGLCIWLVGGIRASYAKDVLIRGDRTTSASSLHAAAGTALNRKCARLPAAAPSVMQQYILQRSELSSQCLDRMINCRFQQSAASLGSLSFSGRICNRSSTATRTDRTSSVQCCTSNGHSSSPTTLPPPRSPFQTGGTLPGTSGGNKRLTLREKPLPIEKQVVVVRHGLTTWNESKRIQVQAAGFRSF